MASSCIVCSTEVPEGRRTCSVECRVLNAGRFAGEKRTREAALRRAAREHPCECCGTLIHTNGRFCSSSCAAKVTNRENPRRSRQLLHDVFCLACGAEIKSYAHRKYCNNVCQVMYQRRLKIDEWFAHPERFTTGVTKWMRDYLLETRGTRCEDCRSAPRSRRTGKAMLQIDHVDGDRRNNRIENHKILCASCHTQTETWGYVGRSK